MNGEEIENKTEKKQNRRVIYTKRVIRESFLELVNKKKLKDITVKEITELADVNRATFYAHYENIDDLKREIEEDMAREIIAVANPIYQGSGDQGGVIQLLFKAMIQRKEISLWFVDDQATGYGSEVIYQYAAKRCVPEWMKTGGLSNEEASRFFDYIYCGTFGLLKQWYQNGCQGDVSKIEREFMGMVSNTLKYVYGD